MSGYVASDPIVWILRTPEEPSQESTKCENLWSCKHRNESHSFVGWGHLVLDPRVRRLGSSGDLWCEELQSLKPRINGVHGSEGYVYSYWLWDRRAGKLSSKMTWHPDVIQGDVDPHLACHMSPRFGRFTYPLCILNHDTCQSLMGTHVTPWPSSCVSCWFVPAW